MNDILASPFRKKLAIAIVVLSFVLLATNVTMCTMAADAEQFVETVETRSMRAEEARADCDQSISEAQEEHLSMYLESVSTSDETSSLAGADLLIADAKDAHNPADKRQHARDAESLIEKVENQLSDKESYLDLLDLALANYQAEPSRVASYSTEVAEYVNALEVEGYFPDHFVETRRGLEEARILHTDAVQVGEEVIENGLPDYLKIYQTCQEAGNIASSAYDLAANVPETRKGNESRIASLRSNVQSVEQHYGEALSAAQNLERYPAYSTLSRVRSGYGQLNGLLGSAEQAELLNAMSEQKFFEASQVLATAEGGLTAIRQTFASAVDNWQKVQAAINQLSSARSRAEGEISSAQSRINSNSHNSQYRAENLLDDAESEVSSGDRNRDTDPPVAVAHYNRAYDLANDAYHAVDTSVEVDYSSGGSSDGGSSSYDYDSGSSWGGGSSGGGSSSYDYGGGSSSPSGGGYGGPSGGGYGDGGF